jgi:hypothetical protein
MFQGARTQRLPNPANTISRPTCYSPHYSQPRHTDVAVGHFKTMVRIFFELTSEMHRSDLSTKSTGTRGRSIGYPYVSIGGFSMTYGLNEAVIDEIVASCNGDLRGALRALLLVNEQLEAELAELYAAAASRDLTERRRRLLH